MGPFSILGLGFLLGIRHATDADHVVAVSAIVARERRLHSAGMVGAIWGLGHTITILIVGTTIILFHVVIPPRLGLFFEFLVAVALIGLGLLNLTGILPRILAVFSQTGGSHVHLHFHGNEPHVHMHMHEGPEVVQEPSHKTRLSVFIQQFGMFQLVRPFIVGLVHGLAGSAAIALLILGSIADTQIAMVYLLVFGVGTIAGMIIITTCIGLPIIASIKKFSNVNKYLQLFSGILSLAFGLYLAYQIGVTNGLFSAHPTWNPH